MEARSSADIQRLCFTEWLGIPIHECPPNYYRLLAIEPFESDPNRIDQAARATLCHIDNHKVGRYVKAAETLSRQVERVRAVLLDPQSKAKYDATLHQKQRGERSDQQVSPAPDADQLPTRQSPPPTISVAGVQSGPTMQQSESSDVSAGPAGAIAAKPARIWYWLAAGLGANALAILAVSAVLLLRSSGEATFVAARPSTPSTDLPSGESSAASPGEPAASSDSLAAQGGGSGEALAAEQTMLEEPAQATEQPKPPMSPDDASLTEEAASNDDPATISEPFKGLASSISLPERPDAIGKPSDVIAFPGKLRRAVIKKLELSLDSSLCALNTGHQFAVVRVPGVATGAWGIRLGSSNSTGESPSNDSALAAQEYLALLSVKDETQLTFRWSSEAPYSLADQLRNALLVLSYETSRHVIALRQPTEGKPLGLDFNQGVIGHAVAIDHQPVREKIYCKLSSLDHFPDSRVVEPMNQTLVLGQSGSISIPPDIEMQLAFEPVAGGDQPGVQLKLEARYHPDNGSRKWSDFTDKEVSTRLAQQAGKISKTLDELNEDLATYREAAIAMPRLQAAAERVSRGKADPAQSTAINSEYQRVSRALRSSQSGIKRHSGNIPGLYKALERLYRIAEVREKLRQVGQIQFHVLAQGDVGEVELAVCQADPLQLAGPIVVAGFNMTPVGTWLQFREPLLVFELAGNNNCIVTNPFDGKPIPGNWQSEGNSVRLSAGGNNQNYDLISPFELRSALGASLYRHFKKQN